MNRPCADLICTRRRLLTGLGVLAGASALEFAAPKLAFASGSPSGSPSGSASGDLLVVVSLSGGADGLSLVPPLADPGYLAARPDIGVTASQALPLDRMFGLHPGLRPLLPFWTSQQLAVVHAVGDADGTRSHFEATDAMDRGVDISSHLATGWIDRHLTVRGLQAADFPALAIASNPAGALAGPAPSIATQDVRSVKLAVPQARQRATERALAGMYAGVAGPSAEAARTTLAAVGTFAKFRDQAYEPRAGVSYPADQLGSSLRQIAQVARAGVGLEVACVSGGGWDTHEAMGGATTGYMASQVGRLGQALAAFAADLGPLLATTTIVTMSEFGRHLTQNGSGGVDHGHGSAMLVLGGGINGGQVYGRWPGLGASQLEDGDLRVTTDYRDVLGELVARRLGGGPVSEVFPGHRPQELGLARQR